MVDTKVVFYNKNNEEVGRTGGSFEFGNGGDPKKRMESQLRGYSNKARGMLRRGYFEDSIKFLISVTVMSYSDRKVLLTGEKEYKILETKDEQKNQS
jgi:hypothetical protein